MGLCLLVPPLSSGRYAVWLGLGSGFTGFRYMLVWLVMFMLVCELNGTGFWLWPLEVSVWMYLD